MKKDLSAAFSQTALRQQERIVQGVIDRFIENIHKASHVSGTRGVNMTEWFEMLAFDALGEMAFGESFGCLESGRPHFWQQMLVKHLFAITLVDNLRRYPLIKWLGLLVLPGLTRHLRERHRALSVSKVARYAVNRFHRQEAPCCSY